MKRIKVTFQIDPQVIGIEDLEFANFGNVLIC